MTPSQILQNDDVAGYFDIFLNLISDLKNFLPINFWTSSLHNSDIVFKSLMMTWLNIEISDN